MKRTRIPVCLFLTVFLGLASFIEAWDMPPRFFEITVDAEAGAANSYLSLGDFFNTARTLRLDLDRLGSREFGLELMARGNFALNVQTRGKHWVGVGLYTGFDVLGFFTISEDVMSFLFRNGDLSGMKGDFALGGGVFADVGIKTSFKTGDFRFTVSPAMYVPVLYMAEPDITYQITGLNPVNGFLRANASVYTAVPVNSDTLDSLAFTTEDLFNVPRGFDLSFDIAYNFYPVLDIGGAIGHIPLYPAYMEYGARIDKTYEINKDNLDLGELLDGGLDGIIDPEPGIDDLEYFSGTREAVFRPLRFSVYGVYKPLEKDWPAFKPWIGFSVFTVYDSACFNFGLDAQFKVVNMLNFYYSFSHMEKVWQNRLTMGINIRIFELVTGIGFRSMDFAGAWNIKGAYAALGLRLGF
jgi:hypothetical protein